MTAILIRIFFCFCDSIPGTIPTEIGRLSNLIEFDIDTNQITGTLPLHIGDMASLRAFYAGAQQSLGGTIPTEIGELTSLTDLYLYNNELFGTIPAQIVNIAGLSKFHIYGNNLSGEIPVLPSFSTSCGSGSNCCRMESNCFNPTANGEARGCRVQNSNSCPPNSGSFSP